MTQDPDVPKLQKLRATLAEGVRDGVFTSESALAMLQKSAEALARRGKRTSAVPARVTAARELGADSMHSRAGGEVKRRLDCPEGN